MGATPNTASYLTGYGWGITVGTVSWAKCERIRLPDATYAANETLHLSGVEVTNDGPTSYGTFEFVIPQDGSASLLSTTAVTGIAVTNGTKTATFNGLITGDTGGEMTRGATVKRVVSGTASSLVVWT
jgi:hypothetical protein